MLKGPCCASRRPSQVPGTQGHCAQITPIPRPIPAIKPMCASRNRRQTCPDRAAGPLARPAPHYAYATRRSTRANHASTANASASTSQDLDVSLPAAAESPSPQRIFFGLFFLRPNRPDRPLSRLISAYTFVELTPASLAIRQRHGKLPRLRGLLTAAVPSRPSSPNSALVSITATCP